MSLEACQKCGLWKYRRKIVAGRGSIPADILIVGEAPGKSEDLVGLPFCGPAGRVLNAAIKEVELDSYYITNVVACRPTDKRHEDNREPTGEEAWACWPRLEAIWKRVNPKVVILLGKVAENHCKTAWPDAEVLQSPGSILQRGGTESIEYKIFVKGLRCIQLKME